MPAEKVVNSALHIASIMSVHAVQYAREPRIRTYFVTVVWFLLHSCWFDEIALAVGDFSHLAILLPFALLFQKTAFVLESFLVVTISLPFPLLFQKTAFALENFLLVAALLLFALLFLKTDVAVYCVSSLTISFLSGLLFHKACVFHDTFCLSNLAHRFSGVSACLRALSASLRRCNLARHSLLDYSDWEEGG